MKEELKKQTFKSEDEEAKWWEANQDALADAFQEAAAAGTLGRGTAARKGSTAATTTPSQPWQEKQYMDNLHINALQARTAEWVETRGLNLYDPVERARRFWEEWFEFGQALGLPYGEAEIILKHVYSKPIGEVRQEAGGAGMTLLALAQSNGFSLGEAIEDELNRVYSLPLERFRNRQIKNAQDGIGAPPEE